MTICPGCFKDSTTTPCEWCQYDQAEERSSVVLRHLTKLNHEHYTIGRVLGTPGGFGITYLGWDLRLKKLVAIKEFLPRNIATRHHNRPAVEHHTAEDAEEFAFGLKQFLEEARTLAQMDHPNIVRVRDYFEENGTGYLVMDYYDGQTLSEFIDGHEEKKLPPLLAIEILMPILDGLKEVHEKGFLHRDIKPQNIYLATENRPILLDFGAARQAVCERHSSMSVVLSEGYAPLEQYQRGIQQGTWTDVYGAASTLYTMITGKQYPGPLDRVDAPSLPIQLPSGGSQYADAIRAGLALEPTERTQTIELFQRSLKEGAGFFNKYSSNNIFEGTKSTFGATHIVSDIRNIYLKIIKPRLIICSTLVYYSAVFLGLHLGVFSIPTSAADLPQSFKAYHAIALFFFFLVPIANLLLRSKELYALTFWVCVVTKIILPVYNTMKDGVIHEEYSIYLALALGFISSSAMYLNYSAMQPYKNE